MGVLGSQEGLFLVPQEAAMTPLRQQPQLAQIGQVWRFITPLFVNESVQSLFYNTLITLILAPRVEKLQGSLSLLGIMSIGGLGGTLFSSLAASTNAVNRACPLAMSWAVIGAQAGCLMINFS